jgi:hypothetical protein
VRLYMNVDSPGILRYTCPITRLSRAASTTALVTSLRALISRIRSIWARSRFSSRKFPPVIRMMAAAV